MSVVFTLTPASMRSTVGYRSSSDHTSSKHTASFAFNTASLQTRCLNRSRSSGISPRSRLLACRPPSAISLFSINIFSRRTRPSSGCGATVLEKARRRLLSGSSVPWSTVNVLGADVAIPRRRPKTKLLKRASRTWAYTCRECILVFNLECKLRLLLASRLPSRRASQHSLSRRGLDVRSRLRSWPSRLGVQRACMGTSRFFRVMSTNLRWFSSVSRTLLL